MRIHVLLMATALSAAACPAFQAFAQVPQAQQADPQAAGDFLREAASRGDAKAAYLLARMLSDGRLAPRFEGELKAVLEAIPPTVHGDLGDRIDALKRSIGAGVPSQPPAPASAPPRAEIASSPLPPPQKPVQSAAVQAPASPAPVPVQAQPPVSKPARAVAAQAPLAQVPTPLAPDLQAPIPQAAPSGHSPSLDIAQSIPEELRSRAPAPRQASVAGVPSVSDMRAGNVRFASRDDASLPASQSGPMEPLPAQAPPIQAPKAQPPQTAPVPPAAPRLIEFEPRIPEELASRFQAASVNRGFDENLRLLAGQVSGQREVRDLYAKASSLAPEAMSGVVPEIMLAPDGQGYMLSFIGIRNWDHARRVCGALGMSKCQAVPADAAPPPPKPQSQARLSQAPEEPAASAPIQASQDKSGAKAEPQPRKAAAKPAQPKPAPKPAPREAEPKPSDDSKAKDAPAGQPGSGAAPTDAAQDRIASYSVKVSPYRFRSEDSAQTSAGGDSRDLVAPEPAVDAKPESKPEPAVREPKPVAAPQAYTVEVMRYRGHDDATALAAAKSLLPEGSKAELSAEESSGGYRHVVVGGFRSKGEVYRFCSTVRKSDLFKSGCAISSSKPVAEAPASQSDSGGDFDRR